MKKRRKTSVKPKETILIQPSYWRLKAELLAIRDLLETAYLEANACAGKMKIKPEVAASEMRQEFRKGLEKLISFHHGKLLIELENHSPELAAALDNRAADEVDTH